MNYIEVTTGKDNHFSVQEWLMTDLDEDDVRVCQIKNKHRYKQ